MAIIRYFAPQGQPILVPITKPVTTIGRALGNDVHVPDRSVADHHAQVVFNGRDFQLEELDRQADILINGKKKRRARLVDGDRLTLGEAHLGFSMFSELPRPSREETTESGGAPSGINEVSGLRKLHAFSERLMTTASVDDLLETLLDAVVEFTGAKRGVVLLVDPEESQSTPRVRASRHVRREAIEDPSGQISDSIVRRVIDSKRPVIVSDALSDTTFGSSESVMALQLSSVMCAPLLSQGNVIGALYVANDEVKHLFERNQLDVLTVFAGQASLILQNAMLLTALRADKRKLEAELSDKRFGQIIGACPSMMEVFRKLQKVAATDIGVLITGETGTGKELIAREIHRRSNRERGPFITVNCGAIPENLIESEMFGHVKGAFTGAIASRPGKFQQADGGTLFLDEVGELPLSLQVKLLRAIQERVVMRVGDSKPEKCDIRIVAATNRNLDEMIKTGEFREDLYYRLNVVNLWLPPLRDRGDDVFIIAKALLSKYADEMASSVRGYSPQALAAIKKYNWPGNIRQLENRIKKALVLCDQSLLSPEDMDLGPEAQEPIVPLEKAKEDFQRRYVLEVLERNNGNRTQTARDLGVDPRTIFRYLEKEQNPMPSGATGGAERDS
ncbi:MAG: sigma 54-interacting transcriptional regulator [Polyangiaceae bacterium]|nr:sigma 54-interacting transcriptional regulator [Myxococcales bacterium]MCB9588906.1 sigma 54-interacting transcriptional regulator [Polyangiaceae bacterium]MCB9605465.1 sigma 54-interacting transcriptional regulator [Polyangiaceae bacterium]